MLVNVVLVPFVSSFIVVKDRSKLNITCLSNKMDPLSSYLVTAWYGVFRALHMFLILPTLCVLGRVKKSLLYHSVRRILSDFTAKDDTKYVGLIA